jgi:NAD(P)-dependent dehydrogenase (short-subunit alcohol dehydrogenase family)
MRGTMTTVNALFDISDEVIVITGGAGMLGGTFADGIVEAGGIPVLLDIDRTALDRQVARLGKRSLGLVCDITRAEQVRHAHDEIIRRFGRVDALINNAANNPGVTADAGMRHSSRVEDMCFAQWSQDLDVGLFGAFLCSKVFGTSMAARRKGSIVNISSDLGIIGPDQRLYRRDDLADYEQDVKPVTYSAVKTGLLGLTRYLATYWARENVRTNAICFGGVLDGQPDSFLRLISERIPLGRMANCEEYKGPIVFLCSQASSYMTGATMVIDGGRTIW